MSTSLLRVSNLAKSFGSATALRDISFDVAAGEVVCIIGPSGCGKSTLLRCINHLTPGRRLRGGCGGLYRARTGADGRVRIQSQGEIDRMRPKMGFVFQQFNLWPHLTVLENIVKGPVSAEASQGRSGGTSAFTAAALRIARQGTHVPIFPLRRSEAARSDRAGIGDGT